MRCIVNGKIVLENIVLEDKALLFEDKIVDIVDKNKINPASVDIIDAEGCYVSPGFIDIHIHGCGGKDTMDGDKSALEVISKTVITSGVTSFTPATMTMDIETINKALLTIRDCVNKDMGGATILGAYLEGPFISEAYKGAQNAKHITAPEYEIVKDFLDILKVIVVAPESDNEFSFIKQVKRSNNEIVISIGHSSASFEQAMQAIKMGVSHTTHTFNAMTPLHHRKPGIVGAAFSTDVTSELIADNIHVHPGLYQLFCDIKGTDNVVLITDSMRAGGLNEGAYELGGQKVIVNSNSARLEDGTLAGSILQMNKAVKNVYQNTNLGICNVVKMASLNPARVLGVDNNKGSIGIGKDADIVIFNDEFKILNTIVDGKTVYRG
ncbi:N-acetylglucosamine-6-phosphate deacetylase [Abyssisolibacter fermentans]|uniref:N-acetylglucosamine-6-phosphate deacetylase n=1 Tax=Abyssisolibacter fermentans TaxID=1766203 RepID=UPI00082E5832|nr:N-acetylglucosamine-6-phosphate deacetylase [Abyssisolibacter fermentans]